MSMIDQFERMILEGKDSALLRFGLGTEYLRAGLHVDAATHLAAAIKLDPGYSAAWKLLGKACEASGDSRRAGEVWRAGIEAALAKGDKQAAKEMQVFLRRLDRAVPG